MKSKSVFFALMWLATTTFGQPQLLKDINVGTAGSLANADNALARVGSSVFFVAIQPELGDELWKTDGTTGGTWLVKDINPGSGGSSLNNFYTLGDSLLLFTAQDGIHGLELWRSNGTEAGTYMVKNIRPGAADGAGSFSNNAKNFIIFNGKLYFNGNNGTNGFELWASDGTEAGTTMIKDIFTNDSGSFPTNFEIHNNTLFFAARSATQGEELWKSDGTNLGTVLVKDIYPGVFSSSPKNLRSLGHTLILSADDGIHDTELWKSDGTVSGTVLVKDIKTNSVGTFGTSGLEVGSNASENSFALVGNIAFFAAIDDSTGIELWKTDGTSAGTLRVKDAAVTIGSNGYAPQNFTLLGNEIYYKYDDQISGIELWKSDGTEAGTNIVKDIRPGSGGSFSLPTYIFSHYGKIYFGANVGPGIGNNELCQSDGTEEGTQLLVDINPGGANSSPRNFISLGKKLFFWANRADTGFEPWVYAVPLNSIDAIVTQASCFGDSTGAIALQISPDGIAPFTAVWEPNWVSGLEASNLPAGTYSVTITDAEGGTGSAIVTIGQPTEIMVNATSTPTETTASNGTATVSPTGGIPPYTYLWNTEPPQTTRTATGLAIGDYICIITDSGGCSVATTITISPITMTSETKKGSIQMQLHPNPAHEVIYWSTPNRPGVSGRIFQANGQIIRILNTIELMQGQLDISALSDGIYYMQIVLETGQFVLAHFVIAR